MRVLHDERTRTVALRTVVISYSLVVIAIMLDVIFYRMLYLRQSFKDNMDFVIISWIPGIYQTFAFLREGIWPYTIDKVKPFVKIFVNLFLVFFILYSVVGLLFLLVFIGDKGYGFPAILSFIALFLVVFVVVLLALIKFVRWINAKLEIKFEYLRRQQNAKFGIDINDKGPTT